MHDKDKQTLNIYKKNNICCDDKYINEIHHSGDENESRASFFKALSGVENISEITKGKTLS